MRFIIILLLAVMLIFVVCAKSTYQLLNCVIRGAIGSDLCKVVMSGRHRRSAFAMRHVCLCAGVLLSVSLPLHGASVSTDSGDLADSLQNATTCVFTENLLFPKASAVVLRDFAGNGSAIDSIRRFLSVTAPQNLLNIKVIGSYSPEGKYTFNKKLAEARARALGRLLMEIYTGVNPEISISHPTAEHTSDYRRMRNAELQIAYRNIASVCDKLHPDTVRSPENGVPKETYDNAAAETREADTISSVTDTIDMNRYTQSSHVSIGYQGGPLSERDGLSLGSRLFITTNMLYDVALIPNIGVGISVSDRVTFLADWMYARWNNHDRRRYWRIYGGDAEVRYRIGTHRKDSPLGGHYVGAYGSIACYDFQAGRSHTGVLSDTYNYAAGVSYTYSLPISTHFNIDFSLGIGYLWGKYKKHTPIDDCDVWLSTHKLGWFGPTRAGVTLVWLVGNRVKNNRKGGSL